MEGDDACHPWASSTSAFGIGDSVGRYVLLARLGRGGMGWVMRALDTELQREVAIKLLLHQRDVDARQRLIREARCMAQLSHPNVLPVYDVGEHEGVVFVAMELVQGQTLRRWLLESPREWTEVVDVFISAGEGLAAAHRMGLVHRDFKPANVMVGDDGRVRVLDFGLARLTVESEAVNGPTAPFERTPGEGSFVSTRQPGLITDTGVVLGTPAYMAPEQFVRTSPDARSDQYAFCTALWEGLYGARPYSGVNALQLRTAKLTPPELPTVLAGPRALSRILLKGLSLRSQDRYCSIEALLAALRRVRRPLASRVTIGLAGGGVAALACLGLAIAGPSAPPPCAGAEAKLEGIWDDGRRAVVGEVLRAAGSRYAEASAEAVEQRLDRYAGRWVASHAEVCEAAMSRGASTDALDRSMACLERRRSELRALVGVLSSADAEVSRTAVAATSRLTSIAPCLRPSDGGERDVVPAEPHRAAQVAELRQALAEARGLHHAGRYEDARARAEHVLERAVTLGFEPLVAETRYELGRALHDLAVHPRATDELEAAYATAVEHQLDELAAHVALSRAEQANHRQEPGSAEHWLAQARARVQRLEAMDGRLGVRLRRQTALLAMGRADFDEARSQLREALALADENGLDELQRGSLRKDLAVALQESKDLDAAMKEHERAQALVEAAVGPFHPAVVPTLLSVSDIHFELGDPERAHALLERSLQIMEQVYGPAHRRVATFHSRMCIAQRKLGNYETSAEDCRRAVEIIAATEGEESSPDLADALNNLSIVQAELGHYDEAIRSLERARSIFVVTLGEEHGHVAVAQANIAQIHYRADRPAQALEGFELALKGLQAAFGRNHPHSGMAWSNVAMARLDLGDNEGAARDNLRALEILEPVLGPDHSHLSFPLHGLGVARLRLGDPAAARPLLERALVLREAGTVAPELIAEAQAGLAQALWVEPEQRERALRLAGAARATFIDTGFDRGPGSRRGRVDDWLRSVGHPPE